MDTKIIKCQVGIIGAGLAGLASTLFCLNKGLDTLTVGDVSELGFASGCLDFYGADKKDLSVSSNSPWAGFESLVNSGLSHPYSFLSPSNIEASFDGFSSFMTSVGLPYCNEKDRNQLVITPAGTLKPSWYIPAGMKAADVAVTEKKKILILDINGLKGFSSAMIMENLKRYGLDVFSDSIKFPGRENSGELNCEMMARDLEMDNVIDAFAQNILEKAGDAEVIGLPAILGIYRSESLRKKIVNIIGRDIFEIPTFSPSVPGLRIKELAFDGLSRKGGKLFLKSHIDEIEQLNGKFVFRFQSGQRNCIVEAENIIMATGRFFGRGLKSENSRIVESLIGLYVSQPENRGNWFSDNFFDKCGHSINKAGVLTDSYFRPLNNAGSLFNENFYTVGSILGNQDWKREKSGAGIAISTAYSAVQSICMQASPFIDSEHKLSNVNKTAA